MDKLTLSIIVTVSLLFIYVLYNVTKSVKSYNPDLLKQNETVNEETEFPVTPETQPNEQN